MAVVGAVQRGQGYLVEAGVGDDLGSCLSNGLYAALARRAIEYAGLTEATAPGAAAGNLDLAPVVDDLGPGHDGSLGDSSVGEILDNAPLHRRPGLGRCRPGYEQALAGFLWLVQAGHVQAGNRCQFAQQLLAVAGALCIAIGVVLLPATVGVQYLPDSFFAFANQKGIEETGQRLGVAGAGTSAEDQRLAGSTLVGANRDPA